MEIAGEMLRKIGGRGSEVNVLQTHIVFAPIQLISEVEPIYWSPIPLSRQHIVAC